MNLSILKAEKKIKQNQLLKDNCNGVTAETLFLVFMNDFLTYQIMAEHYGMGYGQLKQLIKTGRTEYKQKHN